MRKKHFYHKGNFEYISQSKTPLEFIMNDLKANVLSDKQKSWLTYFNKSIYYGRQFNIENPEWDFATVLQMFVNKDTCQMLVKEAYAIPDFHPWEEPFKLEYFSQEAQNLLKKKQNTIRNERWYRKDYGNVLVQTFNIEVAKSLKNPFTNSIHKIIVLIRGDVVYFHSDNIDKLLQFLDKMEPNTWVKDDIYFTPVVVNTKKTQLDFKSEDTIQTLKGVLL